jgi:hypothetical protein
MDRSIIKRAQAVWAIAWLCVTAIALLGCGFPAAAAAALVFAGVSLLAFVALFLYLLLGDMPAAPRVFMIALFLAGVLVELGTMVAVVDYLAGGALGRAMGSGAGF